MTLRLPICRTHSASYILSALLVLSPRCAGEETVSFVNDVVPVLTKAGCNAGLCHAKAGGGQNGFQLSLLGFEPQEDFEHLVLEARGRRLSPAAPERSLLLLKASGQTPHGGGVRLETDSPGYRILRRWIAQGMPAAGEDDPQLVGLAVSPAGGSLQRGDSQQLRSIATYSDGSQRDITTLALYESNDEAMADVSSDGLVRALDIPGKVAVMVRFQGRVAVYHASIPLGAPLGDLPPVRNFIDEFVFANLRELGIPPSPVCDDGAFLRRASLDIGGRLPSADEVRRFTSSDDPQKREKLIDELLQHPSYADFFANKWTALLKNRRDDSSDITSNFAFHAWIRDSLLANAPYDQIVRELLAATGAVISNPPVAWYKRVKAPKQQMEDVAQLFLGVRMQCAQCHHHPFERWSQDDYYGLTAFFTRVGRKPTGTRGEDLIFHQRGPATATNVKTGESIKPYALGDEIGKIRPDEDPRLRLADWMGQPTNRYFAKALVNRYWKHFFGRGLVEPEDDIRDTNPPTNPELLQALEEHFRNSRFDLKELVRVITRSHAYQLSSIPNARNLVDRQNYSRYYPKRLQAEVMLDSIDQLTGANTSFANLPAGTRAVALPDNSYNRSSAFLRIFGRPEAQSVCECERVQAGSLAQSLHLINSPEFKAKLAVQDGRADQLARDERTSVEKVTELFLAAFARNPRPEELEIAIEYLGEAAAGESIEQSEDALANQTQGDPSEDSDQNATEQQTSRENYEDLLWALINTKEFRFNH